MQQHASRSELGLLHVHVSACMRRLGTGRCMHYVKIRRTGRSTNPSIAAATILEDQDLDVIVAPTQSTEGGYESIYRGYSCAVSCPSTKLAMSVQPFTKLINY